jgi:hypothetical protein
LNHRKEEVRGNEFFNKDGKSILAIYFRVKNALPKEKRQNEKTVLNTLKEHKKILTRIKDKKEVSKEQKQSLIELINNMRKKTLSETSNLIYGDKPLDLSYVA